jgi:hypothetical protein
MYTRVTPDQQCFVSWEDGACGMNQKAIAILSGFVEGTLSKLVQKSIAQKSENKYLEPLYCCSKSDYIVDLSYYNHKVWKSEFAYNIICYAATELKNTEAIETLTHLGQIGLRAFIQDLTGFQLTKGSDEDLKALHDILGLKEEMIRRIDHKVANMEFFRDNISDIWNVLFEFRRGVSYYKDLSVLPPQVQRNAFKAINVLKDLFRSIQQLRNDFEVASLDQLSKDRIAMVSKILPAALRSTKSLPGSGLLLKEWQWDSLFSLDFQTLFDETQVKEDKDGVSTFGRRKDITKLAVMCAKENRLASEEEILSSIVKASLKDLKKNPHAIAEMFKIADANYVVTNDVIERLKASIPEQADTITKIYEGCYESRARINHLNNYFRQLEEDLVDTTEDRLYLILQSVELIDDEMERICGEDRFHGFPQPYHDDSARDYVFEDALSLKQFKKCHFYHPDLFDWVYRWEHEILPRLEKECGLPWRNTLKMSSLKGFAHKKYLVGADRFDTALAKHYTFEPSPHGDVEEDYARDIMTSA